MKLITVVVIGVAIGTVVVGIGNRISWHGQVYMAANSAPVPRAAALLVMGDSVLSVTTADDDGEFRITVGWKRNPAHRLMVCKAGSEPSELFQRPAPAVGMARIRVVPGRYPLRPARPDHVSPTVTLLSGQLPPACH